MHALRLVLRFLYVFQQVVDICVPRFQERHTERLAVFRQDVRDLLAQKLPQQIAGADRIVLRIRKSRFAAADFPQDRPDLRVCRKFTVKRAQHFRDLFPLPVSQLMLSHQLHPLQAPSQVSCRAPSEQA